MDELIADFIAETGASLAQIDADFAVLAREGAEGEALLRIVRALHTIKGACGFLKMPRCAALAHAGEGALIRWRDGRAAAETRELVQAAVAQIGELLAGVAENGSEPEGADGALLAALAAMPNALDWAVELTAIRDKLLVRAGHAIGAHFPKPPETLPAPTAMAPIDVAWRTLPLLVEELAGALGKSIALTIEGGETETPRAALAPLRDALGHLIRNCADHGLETPAERRAAGKPETGAISLSATREGEQIVIRLADDGRGLDTARIRRRAISQGLVFASHAARMETAQIHSYVFAPGFSTADAATTLSGRGIGLDAVRAAVEEIGGGVSLRSEFGRGTVFALTIPSKMAIASPDEETLRAAAIAHVA